MSGDDDPYAARGADHDRQSVAGMVEILRAAMQSARTRSIGSGRWLGETMLDVATHVPVRDLATLRDHYGGRSGQALAYALLRNAVRTTAAVGAVAGAVVGTEELAPPAWLALPAELVLETLAVVGVEMKLVAELHAAYGRPITGTATERGIALARAWADRRGVTARGMVQSGGLGQPFAQSTRREVTRLLQRRLARRALRNVPTLAPFLIGAVAGAEINRRATRALGMAVVRDLDATAGSWLPSAESVLTVRTVPSPPGSGREGGTGPGGNR